jgi:hypothetical protein
MKKMDKTNSDNIYPPLKEWVYNKSFIPKRFYTPGVMDNPNYDWSYRISIEEKAPLHLANSMKWQSLKVSRELTASYLEDASEMISGLSGGSLDSEERSWVIEKLGPPPIPSLPIYFVSCVDENGEKLMYIGKTKNVSRFRGGHNIALKLHSPEFSRKEKYVYRGAIWFYIKEEYIALDWIQPEILSFDLLDSIESHLIYHYQPPFNKMKRKRILSKWDFEILIKNRTGNGFLHNDVF